MEKKTRRSLFFLLPSCDHSATGLSFEDTVFLCQASKKKTVAVAPEHPVVGVCKTPVSSHGGYVVRAGGFPVVAGQGGSVNRSDPEMDMKKQETKKKSDVPLIVL